MCIRDSFLLVASDIDIALLVIPGRDLVAPPQLARDTPVLDLAHPGEIGVLPLPRHEFDAVSYTHLRAHETVLDLVCRLLLEKKTKIYH